MKKKFVFVFTFLFTVGSCGPAAEIPNTETFIINGSVDNDAAHDAVAFLYLQSGYACGGTLITPTILITAAHCATLTNSTTPVAVDQFMVVFCRDLNNCDSQKRSRGVLQSWIHPSYDPRNIRYDIALLRLSAPAPGDVMPISPLPSSLGLTNADIGSPITFIGYGLTNGSDPNSSSTVRRIFTGSIAGLCHSSSSCTINTWQGTYAAPWTIWTIQNSGGTCQGDSGGPGLITRSGTRYVAGITSYGYSECAGPGVYTEVSNYESNINAFINSVPAEVCSDNQDNDGDGAKDCADADCTGIGSCPVSPCDRYQYLYCNQTITAHSQNGIAGFNSYNCMSQGQETGPETAYQLAIPPGTQVQVTLIPEEQDLDLFLVTGDRRSCSSSACIAYSANNALDQETLSFTVGETPTYLIVESYRYPSRYSLTTSCVFPPENCANNIDDDGDDKIDCTDSDCVSMPECTNPTQEYNCVDSQDNDDDGATDCADSDCFSNNACAGLAEQECGDSRDNDNDGWADCFDSDCYDAPECQKSSDTGCSCRVGTTHPSSFFFVLGMLGMFLVLRRFSGIQKH